MSSSSEFPLDFVTPGLILLCLANSRAPFDSESTCDRLRDNRCMPDPSESTHLRRSPVGQGGMLRLVSFGPWRGLKCTGNQDLPRITRWGARRANDDSTTRCYAVTETFGAHQGITDMLPHILMMLRTIAAFSRRLVEHPANLRALHPLRFSSGARTLRRTRYRNFGESDQSEVLSLRSRWPLRLQRPVRLGTLTA